MTNVEIAEIAGKLYQAERQRQPIRPIIDEFTDVSINDAYNIQLAVLDMHTASGARIIGKKTGLTSKAMQQMLGVTEPDFGHLLDSMSVADGASVLLSEMIQPKVEPEITFVLKRDLTGPGITLDQVLDATEYVCASLEIIDSRIENWKIKLADTVADNASSCRFVLGRNHLPPNELDLRLMGMILEKNGEIVASGAGGAVLGHPGCAVAWLANRLAEFGFSLKAQEVILPGALCGAVAVGAGDVIAATFDRLGSVSVKFI